MFVPPGIETYVRRLSRVWKILTKPSPALTSPEDIRRAQNTAGLLLFYLPVGILLVIFNRLITPQEYELLWIAALVEASVLAAYLLARTRHYRMGIMLTLVVARLTSVAVAALNENLILILAFVPISTMLVGYVLNRRSVLLLTAVDISSIIFITVFIPIFPVPVGASLLSLSVLAAMLSLGAASIQLREITLLREQTMRLREGEARFRMMADTAPVMIWTSNLQRECDYFNKPHLDFTGHTLDHEIGDGWASGVYPDDRPVISAVYSRAFNERQPFEITYRMKRFDGEYRWLLENGIPRFLEDGTFIGYIGSCIDITDRIRAEQAVSEGAQRYRMLFEQASDAIFILELDQTIIAVNQQVTQQLGYTSEELVGQPSSMTKSPEQTQPAQPFWQQLLAGEDVPVYEQLMQRKDGSTYTAEIKIALVRNLDGSPRYAQAVVRDVSARRRYEQEHLELLKQNARMDVLRRFISDASHDLRTPLSIINTSLYLLRHRLKDWPPPVMVTNHLSVMEKQSQHLAQVVDDLLSMSLLDEDRQHFCFEPTDIHLIIRQVTYDLAVISSERSQNVSFPNGEPPVMVLADSKQIERAIRAVMLNALQYTAEGGRISLQVTRVEPFACVAVQDTGAGIKDSDLPHIFEHFYRGDSARPVETGGAGIGLAMTRKIMEAHHGRIEVESETGVGSTFRLFLPLAQEPAASVPSTL